MRITVERIISMYITLLPPILAGIANMVWCKVNFLKSINKPMDFGIRLKDGERLFGDHKTWKGFVGYLVLNVIMTLLVGLLCAKSMYFMQHDYLYVNHENTLVYNLIMGILFGLGYSLFELPNSFLKRRMKIVPGKRAEGSGKVFFAILDQADSVIGCVLVLCLVYPMGIGMFCLYIFLGTATHMVLNMLLYFAHLRKNIL